LHSIKIKNEVKAEPIKEMPEPDDVFNKTLAEKINDTSFDHFLQNYTGLAKQYLSGLVKDVNNEFDTSPLGVRWDLDSEEFKLGRTEIEFHNDDIIINTRNFPGSRGLYELIFKKNPGSYSKDDWNLYSEILFLTSAYKRGFDPDKQYAGTRSEKWRKIIRPMITDDSDNPDLYSTPQRMRTHSFDLPATLR